MKLKWGRGALQCSRRSAGWAHHLLQHEMHRSEVRLSITMTGAYTGVPEPRPRLRELSASSLTSSSAAEDTSNVSSGLCKCQEPSLLAIFTFCLARLQPAFVTQVRTQRSATRCDKHDCRSFCLKIPAYPVRRVFELKSSRRCWRHEE